MCVKIIYGFWIINILMMLTGVEMQAEFKLETMEIKMNKDTMSIFIKDIQGIERIKFTVIHNCPLKNVIDINSLPEEYTYAITSPTNGLWRMEITTQLNDYDLICINADIQYKGRSYMQKTPPVRVGELRMGTICEPTKTTTAFGRSDLCTNSLIFDDEFLNLNNSKWRMEVRIALFQRHEEFVQFDDSTENSFVKNNRLYILPKIVQGNLRMGSIDLGSKCTGQYITECKLSTDLPYHVLPPVKSALLNTRNSIHFQYGRVEVKAKLPKGDWLFPYVSLQSVSNYERAEIRIAFARGNEELKDNTGRDVSGKRLYGGIIYWDKTAMEHATMNEVVRDEHFGDDFHIYMMTWKENSISFAVDGEVYGEITENMEKFQQPFYITLGVSAGGHIEFKDVTAKPWTDTSARAALHFYNDCDVWGKTWNNPNEALLVDYIRVYAI